MSIEWGTISLTGAITTALNAIVFGFWKPWAAGYSAEKSKNFARKEDLAEILAEVRAVTVTQKEIETKLSGEQWDRQTRWNQKRDLYGDLLTIGQDLGSALGRIPSILKMQADDRPNFKATGNKNLSECLDAVSEGTSAFNKKLMLAMIFMMPESVTALKAFIHARIGSYSPTLEWASSEAAKYNTLVSALLSLARKDLNIE